MLAGIRLFSASVEGDNLCTCQKRRGSGGGASWDFPRISCRIYAKAASSQMCIRDSSKGEARRLVQQGGVTVCGQKVADIEARFSCKDCCGEGAVIKKGKKVYHKAVLEEQ